MPVARTIGLKQRRRSSREGSKRPIRDGVARLGVLQVAQDLGDAEHAHREDREVHAVGKFRDAQRQALLAGLEVGAHRRRKKQAEHDHDQRFSTEPRASTIASPRPNTIRPKYSAGPKSSASR